MSANQSVQLKVPQTEAVPLSYQVPGAQLIELQAVYGEFDGSGAAGSYLPAVEILSQDGLRMMLCPVSSSVAAGSDADATFGPFLGGQQQATPAASGALTLLKTITLTANGSISWGRGANGNIPFTYRDLIIVGIGRTTLSGQPNSVNIRFNGDTGAAYSDEGLILRGGTLTEYCRNYPSTTPPLVADWPSAGSPSGYTGAFEATIFGYSQQVENTKIMIACGNMNTTTPTLNEGNYGTWSNASYVDARAQGISLLEIDGVNFGGSLLAGSRVDFYGRGTA